MLVSQRGRESEGLQVLRLENNRAPDAWRCRSGSKDQVRSPAGRWWKEGRMQVSEAGELVGTTRAVRIGQRLVRSHGKRCDLEALRLLRPGWIEKCQQRE